MNLNKLVQAAIFAAMAIGLGFMFMLVPNLEFITVTVFLSGLTLGMGYGTLVGGTAMLIYSAMNPLGSGLIYFTLLLGQILAMAGIGLLGSISKQFLRNDLISREKKRIINKSTGFRSRIFPITPFTPIILHIF